MNLDLTPNPDGFGARLNRTVSLRKWNEIIEGNQAQVNAALREFGFLEGKVWPFSKTKTVQEQILRRLSMFLHRDGTQRLMVAPKGIRKEGTWLFPDEEYTQAQWAGISALMESEDLSSETRSVLDIKRKRLGTESAENIPIGLGVVTDPAFSYEHVKKYQAAVLEHKGPKAQKMTWDDRDLFARKLVIMRTGLPHMRELSTPLDFSSGPGVDYVDAKR